MMAIPTNKLLPSNVADDDVTGILRKDHALQGLTGQQELFCKLLFTGVSQSDAYRQAYHCASSDPSTVQHMASLAAKNPKVVARLNQLTSRWEQRASLDALIRRDEIARGIAEIAFDPTNKTADRLRAYEMLGKIGGIDLFKAGTGDKKPDEMSLDQVEQLLAKKLAQLRDVTPSQ